MSASAAASTRNSDTLAMVLERMTNFERSYIPIQRIRETVPLKSAQLEAIPDSGLLSTPKSTPTLTPPHVASSLTALVDSTQDTRPMWKMDMPTRYKCTEWCSCVCHQKSSFKSPWILKSIFGSIFIDYSIRGLVCNEHSCHRYNVSSLRMTFCLPRYLIDRYITMVWKYTPQEGSAFFMRMPRIMPWTHLLWTYANRGDIIAVRRLFSESKASPYDISLLGGNALIYAATHGNARLGQFLIRQGADAELADTFGRKPIEAFWDQYLSGQMGADDGQIVRCMFQDSDYAEIRCFTLIHKIVLGIVSRDLGTELHSSTAAIDVRDALNRTPICWATLRDDPKAVSMLLAFNANPNIADYQGNNCLFYARSTEVCKLLLCANTDLHARNRKYARLPLHEVCCNVETAEIPNVVDRFVNAGADVNVRDLDGETPLLNAVYKRYTSIARKLIDLGADVNIPNHSSQETAIHFAVSFDHFEILPLLLDKGADYTAKNIHGRNILHMAALMGGPKTVATLSKANLMGLDTSLKDDEGKTVYDHLAEREILSDSEVGLHQSFEELLASINTIRAPLSTSSESPTNFENNVYDLESQRKSNASYHVPGTYPMFDGD